KSSSHPQSAPKPPETRSNGAGRAPAPRRARYCVPALPLLPGGLARLPPLPARPQLDDPPPDPRLPIRRPRIRSRVRVIPRRLAVLVLYRVVFPDRIATLPSAPRPLRPRPRLPLRCFGRRGGERLGMVRFRLAGRFVRWHRVVLLVLAPHPTP